MKLDFSSVPGEVTLNESLAGGVVSEVCAATLLLEGGKVPHNVVVKHTASLSEVGLNFDMRSDGALIMSAPETHHLDAEILGLLQKDPHVRVPRVRYYDKAGRFTIMDDFRYLGYTLMQDLILKGELPLSSASALGNALGHLQLRLRQDDVKSIVLVEDPEVQVFERLDELLPLLRDDLNLYREIRDKFLDGSGPIHVDGHPKNVGVNAGGNVILIDFGRMICANEQYPAPNFAAHIVLAILGGVIPLQVGKTYIRQFVEAYNSLVPIEEKWFVRFLLAELVHRGLALRWINPAIIGEVNPKDYKLAVYGLFLDAIRSAHTIDDFLTMVGPALPLQFRYEG